MNPTTTNGHRKHSLGRLEAGVLALLVSLGAERAARAEIWGFADLHDHPMSHLAFGGTPGGRSGLFIGSPAAADGTQAQRLAVCNTVTHSDFADVDVGRKLTQSILTFMTSRQSTLPRIHGSLGQAPPGSSDVSFRDWPQAKDVLHQQMDVAWLRRAHQGGLRLLVASATSNEILDGLYKRSTATGTPPLAPVAGWALATARTQLTFMHDFVHANSDFMKLVTDATSARAAAEAGYLAVVLGVELDTLTVDEILDLAAHNDVRVAVPIHMVDNTFGGTAAYQDAFNALELFYRGGPPAGSSLIQVTDDSALDFRLSANPPIIRPVTGLTIKTALESSGIPVDFLGPFIQVFGPSIPGIGSAGDLVALMNNNSSLMLPMPFTVPPTGLLSLFGFVSGTPPANYVCDFTHNLSPWTAGHPAGCLGHRNVLGLRDGGAGVSRLMRAGVIVDLAHMSQAAMAATLTAAETLACPVMNSHTLLRSDAYQAGASERSMRISEASRVNLLGGVVGFGTVGRFQPMPVFHLAGGGDPDGGFLKLAAGERWAHTFWQPGDDVLGDHRYPRFSFDQLSITVKSGLTGVRCNNHLTLAVLAGDGTTVTTCPLNSGVGWDAGSTHTVSCSLPRALDVAGVPANRISGFVIGHDTPHGCGLFDASPDNPNIDELLVQGRLSSDPSFRTILQRRGSPFVRLSGDLRSLTMALPDYLNLEQITGFRIVTRTTDDDLNGSRPATVTFNFGGPLQQAVVLGGGGGFPGSATASDTFSLSTVSGGRITSLPLSALESITATISTDFALPVGFDNWTSHIDVFVETRDHGEQPFLVGANSTLRFTMEERAIDLYRKIHAGSYGAVDGVMVTFSTRDVDIDAGRLQFAVSYRQDGGLRTASAVVGATGQTIAKGESRTVVIPFFDRGVGSDGRPRTTNYDALEELSVFSSVPVVLDDLYVQVIRDPSKLWAEDYVAAKHAFGDRAGAVAFGTDMNGISDQISFTTVDVPYPFVPATAAGRADPSGRTPASMSNEVVGISRLQVKWSGIGNVGLLPDFAYAADVASPAGSRVGADLYHSAEAFVKMWEVTGSPGHCGHIPVITLPPPMPPPGAPPPPVFFP